MHLCGRWVLSAPLLVVPLVDGGDEDPVRVGSPEPEVGVLDGLADHLGVRLHAFGHVDDERLARQHGQDHEVHGAPIADLGTHATDGYDLDQILIEAGHRGLDVPKAPDPDDLRRASDDLAVALAVEVDRVWRDPLVRPVLEFEALELVLHDHLIAVVGQVFRLEAAVHLVLEHSDRPGEWVALLVVHVHERAGQVVAGLLDPGLEVPHERHRNEVLSHVVDGTGLRGVVLVVRHSGRDVVLLAGRTVGAVVHV